MTARQQPNRPADHTAGLTNRPSVVGRGTDEIQQAEVDALYSGAPDTRYGIGPAGVAVEVSPVAFEDYVMAALDEQGEVEL